MDLSSLLNVLVELVVDWRPIAIARGMIKGPEAAKTYEAADLRFSASLREMATARMAENVLPGLTRTSSTRFVRFLLSDARAGSQISYHTASGANGSPQGEARKRRPVARFQLW